MNRLQLMMIAVAATAFLAGLGVGLAVPVAASSFAGPIEDDPDQKFVQTFVEKFDARFDLRPAQVRDLRGILLHYCGDKVRIAANAGYQQWPQEQLQSRLAQCERQMQKRIEWILDEDQRERYRREIQSQQLGK